MSTITEEHLLEAAPAHTAPAVAEGLRAGQQRIEELGRIILAYSEVTERLQKSHEQLMVTVQKLRTELGEKNRQLERRKRLAALGEMAAGMAHEIRNPLGAIQLYSSMLAGDVKALPESAKLVDKISGGVRRMEDIVTKVLHFSRDLRIDTREGDVGELIAECIEIAQAKAGQLGVTIELRGNTDIRANFDQLLMSQAVLNILINAVEATGSGKQVSVEWGRENEKVFIRVVDQGAGVSAEVMDRIFNPFFTTKDEGTGLGLAIVHRIVEGHDGVVSVKNVEHGGAAFEIRW